jgi:hypothetical protein
MGALQAYEKLGKFFHYKNLFFYLAFAIPDNTINQSLARVTFAPSLPTDYSRRQDSVFT